MPLFSDREQEEIRFARTYYFQFNHGTSGNMEYTVIAKLSERVEELEAQIAELKKRLKESEPQGSYLQHSQYELEQEKSNTTRVVAVLETEELSRLYQEAKDKNKEVELVFRLKEG